ncbi:hypothetical protein TTHERM_00537170 (macronuclear) [Tetrahymena thermophila SB210]|uniref:Uncharacterized protein n=1 Tax=Tetrahymena thermophila (strain SB210) TaxID=312017 RepID=I7MLY2_TETTS|nr:hypothetical protein TTHERM_00537170 [Tetrahymena thermophila SB210]EAS03282.1 hypothetical protein TTHERM_00537170 [Tetrahymena thermophila SB210]|eukprot:XP_001023527.1 hypothetical protein TTHERM_00537170 [Tetrahymena thermophila SB210]
MQLSNSEQDILKEFNSRVKSVSSNQQSNKNQVSHQTKGSATIQTNLQSNSDLNTTQLQNDGLTYIQEDGDTSINYYNPQKSYSSERQQLRFGAGAREQSQVKCVFELQHDDDEEEQDHSVNRSLLDDTRKFYSNIKKSNNNSAKKYKVNSILQQKNNGIDDQNYHTFSNNMYNTINSGYASSTNPNLNSQLCNLPSNILLNSQNQGNLSLFHSTNNNSFNQLFDKSPPCKNLPFINPYFFPKKYVGSGQVGDYSGNSHDFKRDLASQVSTQNATAPMVKYSDFLFAYKGNNNEQLNISYSNYLAAVTSSSQRNNSYSSNNINSQKYRTHQDSQNLDYQAKLIQGMKRPSSKQLSLISDQHQISNIQTQASYNHSRQQLHYQLPLQHQIYNNQQNASYQKYSSGKKYQNRSQQSQDEKSILKSSLLSQLKDESQNFCIEDESNQIQEEELQNQNNNNNNLFDKQYSKETNNQKLNNLEEEIDIMNDLQQNNENAATQIVYADLKNKSNQLNLQKNELGQTFETNLAGNQRSGRFQVTDFINQFNKNNRLKIYGIKNYEKHQEHEIFFNHENPSKIDEEERFFNTASKGNSLHKQKKYTKDVISPGRDQQIEQIEETNRQIKSLSKHKNYLNYSDKENQCLNYSQAQSSVRDSQFQDCQKVLFTDNQTKQNILLDKDSLNSSTLNEDRAKQLFSFSKPESRLSQQNQASLKYQNQNRLNFEQQYHKNTNKNQQKLNLNKSEASSNQVNSQQFTTFSPSKRIQGIVQEVSQQSLQNGQCLCNLELKQQTNGQNINYSKVSQPLRNKESIISNDSVFFIDLKKNNQAENTLSQNQRTYEYDENCIQEIDLENQQAYSLTNSKYEISSRNKKQQVSPQIYQDQQYHVQFQNPYLIQNRNRKKIQTPTLQEQQVQNNHKSQHSTERREYFNCLEPKNKFNNYQNQKNTQSLNKQQNNNNNIKISKNVTVRSLSKHQQNPSLSKGMRVKTLENEKKIRSKSVIENISKIANKQYITYLLQNHASCCRNFRKELNKSLNI